MSPLTDNAWVTGNVFILPTMCRHVRSRLYNVAALGCRITIAIQLITYMMCDT